MKLGTEQLANLLTKIRAHLHNKALSHFNKSKKRRKWWAVGGKRNWFKGLLSPMQKLSVAKKIFFSKKLHIILNQKKQHVEHVVIKID